jgi:uncharacterized membrane protein
LSLSRRSSGNVRQVAAPTVTSAQIATPDYQIAPEGSVLFARSSDKGRSKKMSILFVIIAIVAIVLAITGGLIHAVSFLLWVGIVLLILAVIAFLIRSISGRSRV